MANQKLDLNLGQFNPVYYSKNVQKQIIGAFLKDGQSVHSANHDTIGYIIRYCEEKEIQYSINCWPGKGYFIKKEVNTDIDMEIKERPAP